MKLIDQLALSLILEELVEQIEMNDFRDSHGHELKMLKAYKELKILLKK